MPWRPIERVALIDGSPSDLTPPTAKTEDSRAAVQACDVARRELRPAVTPPRCPKQPDPICSLSIFVIRVLVLLGPSNVSDEPRAVSSQRRVGSIAC